MKLGDLDKDYASEISERKISDILTDFDFSTSKTYQEDRLVEKTLHLLEATINHMAEMERTIGSDASVIVERKLLNAIRQKTHVKFERQLRKVIDESK